MNYSIDAGRTFLPVCACGWRGDPVLTRIKALELLKAHEERAHYGDQDVADMLRRERQHAGRKSK